MKDPKKWNKEEHFMHFIMWLLLVLNDFIVKNGGGKKDMVTEDWINEFIAQLKIERDL